jgi:arginine repressor
LIGQIYLALDGSRSQREVFEVLKAAGIETSEMTVSRAMGKMHTELGIIELVSAGGSKVYRKGDESEAVLNLSAKIREWLKERGEPDPAPPPGRKRRKTS